jgi:hypothetical protein
LAAALALRRLDDFDTWWHLAAGRWIASHGAIPATDTLSSTVRDHPWIDLQWGFDLLVYALHSAGGPALLGAAGALFFMIAVVLVLRLAGLELGGAGAALLGLPVVLVLEDRLAVRPEMLSFPLLACVLTVLERSRNRDVGRPWLLVPLMVVWVNVHALFAIGAFAIACFMVDAAIARSRSALLWGGVALGAALLNPYFIRGALFPFKLLSRIDGSNAIFKTIGEFRSPWAGDASGVAIWVYRALLVAGALAVATALVLKGRRHLDLGRTLFFAGLAALSVAARRNIALFAVGAAPVIARSVATIGGALPATARETARRVARPLTLAVLGLAVLLSATVVTGAYYRWDHQPREFGLGTLDGTFPVRAVEFAREAKLPGKLFNDIAAGGYLAWDDPVGDGVFIDGRLEVYDTEFFNEYVMAMYDPARLAAIVERYEIRTIFLFHRWENRRLLVERLLQDPAWSLVYADEVAAVFVRAAGNEAAIARATSMSEAWNRKTRDWLSRPVPRWPYPAGRVEATRAFARLLATVGDADGAAETYTTLLTMPIPSRDEIDVRTLLARRYAATGRMDEARSQARRILALDPANAEAQKLAR